MKKKPKESEFLETRTREPFGKLRKKRRREIRIEPSDLTLRAKEDVRLDLGKDKSRQSWKKKVSGRGKFFDRNLRHLYEEEEKKKTAFYRR